MKKFLAVNKLIMIALAMLLVLSACGSGNQTTTGSNNNNETNSNQVEPVANEKWIHGVISFKGDAGFQAMGLKQGYYEKLGVDFEIMQFESDSTMIKALIAGEIDSMATSPSTALVAISQGQDIRFVATEIPEISHLVFTKKDINSLEELEGKNIGISGSGGVPHVLAQGLFHNTGLGDMKVNWVNAGGSGGRFKALIAGKIDMAIASVDFLPMAEKEPNIHVIANLGEELPNYVRVAFMVNGKTVENRGEVLTKVLKAEAQGIRYAIEHRDETIALTAETIDKDVADPGVIIAYDDHVDNKYLNPNLVFDPKSIQWMFDLGVKTGSIENPNIDLDKYIDLSFAEKVLEEIGEFSW